MFSSRAVCFNKLSVGKFPLRILIEHFQVSMSRGGVQIVVQFLAVLAVIALTIGQPEQALLEDRITFVPQREGEAKSLVLIGESGDAILAPSIGAAAGMVVGQILPRVAILTVVFPYRPPL